MTINRYAKKVDANQARIVTSLRNIPGVTVALDHHDLLVGHKGVTYWYELKSPDHKKKDGNWKSGTLKKSQRDLLRNWTGHYRIVSTLDEILTDLGIK